MAETNILSFMRRKNIAQTELAKILSCTDSMVSLYASGKSGISSEKMHVLIEMGITPEELFGDKTGKIMRRTILKESIQVMPENEFEEKVIAVLNKVFNSGQLKISFQQ